jgi:Flp pilus assembly protein TadD
MLDDEHPIPLPGHGTPVISLTDRPAAAPAEPTASAVSPANPLLARLLAIADGYRTAGNFRQAIEVFLTLIDDHPDSSEARQARAMLLEIGAWYERHGDFRQARSLYERLL